MTFHGLNDSQSSQKQCVIFKAGLIDRTTINSWKVICIDMKDGEEIEPMGNLLKIIQDLNDGIYK